MTTLNCSSKKVAYSSCLQDLSRKTPTTQIVIWWDRAMCLDIEFDPPRAMSLLFKKVFSPAVRHGKGYMPAGYNRLRQPALEPAWTQFSPRDKAKLTIASLLNMVTDMDDALVPFGMINETWQPRPQLLADGIPIKSLQSIAIYLVKLSQLILDHGSGLVPSAYLASVAESGPADNPAWNRC
jgi:hypothetical protein